MSKDEEVASDVPPPWLLKVERLQMTNHNKNNNLSNNIDEVVLSDVLSQ